MRVFILPCDAADLTVSGIALGTSSHDVIARLKAAQPELRISEAEGTLHFADYTTPSLHFGTTGFFNRPMADYSKNGENFNIVYDLGRKHAVIAVERFIEFAHEKAPLYAKTIDSLIEKYGKPTLVLQEGSGASRYIWSRSEGADLLHTNSRMDCDNFEAMMLQTTDGSGLHDEYNQRRWNCGTNLSVAISFMVNEKGMRQATDLNFRLVDYDALRSSYDFAWATLKAGSDEIQQRRNGNTPPPF